MCHLYFSLSKCSFRKNVDIIDKWKHQRILIIWFKWKCIGENLDHLLTPWKQIPTQIVFGTQRWIPIRDTWWHMHNLWVSLLMSLFIMIWLHFLKAKFAMLCYEGFLPWKMLCHESFGRRALRKWHIFLCIFLKKSLSPLLWYSNT